MTDTIPTTARFTEAEHARIRKGLMRRGRDLATRLSEVLSGLDGDRLVRALGLDAKPGMRPEEILRKALADVEGLRKWLDDGDDRFGRCHVCGVDLGAAGLQELPWADTCVPHAGTPRGAH
jgi:RNA polymerase-binding transcription factor DksA